MRERVGEPFELEFTDAITGRSISMKGLRGRVVVVDFWATWCGPCVGEIPELKRLYTKYHDKGVEFIGVSHDLPEADGGLEALKTFVKMRHMPWPQYFQGVDNQAVVTASPTNNFSESWGISGIPTVFIIDTEGKLYSTEREEARHVDPATPEKGRRIRRSPLNHPLRIPKQERLATTRSKTSAGSRNCKTVYRRGRGRE